MSKHESVWKSTAMLKSHSKLSKDIECDVLVIGGGISGVLTTYFLKKNNIPTAPIYQQWYQLGKKSTLIKGRVDVFIDDSIENMIELNLAGIPCLLMDSENNQDWGPIGRVFSLNHDHILETYELFMKTSFKNFKDLL